MEGFKFFDNLTSLIEYEKFYDEHKGKQLPRIVFSDRKSTMIVVSQTVVDELKKQGHEQEIYGSRAIIGIHEFIVKEQANTLKLQIEDEVFSLTSDVEKRAFLKETVSHLEELKSEFYKKMDMFYAPRMKGPADSIPKAELAHDIIAELDAIKTNLVKSYEDLYLVPYNNLFYAFRSNILYITDRKREMTESPLLPHEKTPEERMMREMHLFFTEKYSKMLNTWLYEKKETGTLYSEQEFLFEIENMALELLVDAGNYYSAPWYSPLSFLPSLQSEPLIPIQINPETYVWYQRNFLNQFLSELKKRGELLQKGSSVHAIASSKMDYPLKSILKNKEKANQIFKYLLEKAPCGESWIAQNKTDNSLFLVACKNKPAFLAAIYHTILGKDLLLRPQHTESNVKIICEQFTSKMPNDLKYYQPSALNESNIKTQSVRVWKEKLRGLYDLL